MSFMITIQFTIIGTFVTPTSFNSFDIVHDDPCIHRRECQNQPISSNQELHFFSFINFRDGNNVETYLRQSVAQVVSGECAPANPKVQDVWHAGKWRVKGVSPGTSGSWRREGTRWRKHHGPFDVHRTCQGEVGVLNCLGKGQHRGWTCWYINKQQFSL